MRARAFARTRPDISSPLIYGGMEMGGCAIGRACMRMRERRERGREGRFYLLQGISQGGLLSLSLRYLLFAARNIPRMLSRMRMRPPDYAPTFSPPPIYRGGKMGI